MLPRPLPNNQVISVRLDDSTYQKLISMAVKNEKTVSNQVRDMLKTLIKVRGL